MGILSRAQLENALTAMNVEKAGRDALLIDYTDNGGTYEQGVSNLVNALLTAGGNKDAILSNLHRLKPLTCSLKTYPIPFFDVLILFPDSNQVLQLCTDVLSISQMLSPDETEKALGNMITYVGRSLLKVDKCGRLATAMAHRLNHLACYLSGLAGGDGLVKKTFPRKNYKLLLSGSDGHLNNKQVIFLKDEASGKCEQVLKPRSLAPDYAAQRCLHEFNQYLPPEFQLPVIPIKANECGAWGFEPYIEKKTRMEQDMAARYYRKMGVLIFFSKLIGFTDLHQDNVMPTENGPVAVDGECIFDPWVIANDYLFSTFLNRAVDSDSNEQGPGKALAVFEITGQGKSNDSWINFQKEISDGFATAQSACNQHADKLFKFFEDRMSEVGKIRWVPLSTARFADMAVDYYIGAKLETLDPYRSLAKTLERYVSVNDGLRLATLIQSSVAKGDLPYFTVHISKNGSLLGTIECDGVPIGNAEHLFALPFQSMLQRNLAFLNSKSAVMQLERFLHGR